MVSAVIGGYVSLALVTVTHLASSLILANWTFRAWFSFDSLSFSVCRYWVERASRTAEEVALDTSTLA